jgi:hypothetical protein
LPRTNTGVNPTGARQLGQQVELRLSASRFSILTGNFRTQKHRLYGNTRKSLKLLILYAKQGAIIHTFETPIRDLQAKNCRKKLRPKGEVPDQHAEYAKECQAHAEKTIEHLYRTARQSL